MDKIQEVIEEFRNEKVWRINRLLTNDVFPPIGTSSITLEEAKEFRTISNYNNELEVCKIMLDMSEAIKTHNRQIT